VETGQTRPTRWLPSFFLGGVPGSQLALGPAGRTRGETARGDSCLRQLPPPSRVFRGGRRQHPGRALGGSHARAGAATGPRLVRDHLGGSGLPGAQLKRSAGHEIQPPPGSLGAGTACWAVPRLSPAATLATLATFFLKRPEFEHGADRRLDERIRKGPGQLVGCPPPGAVCRNKALDPDGDQVGDRVGDEGLEQSAGEVEASDQAGDPLLTVSR
jgi:hypothetical protein